MKVRATLKEWLVLFERVYEEEEDCEYDRVIENEYDERNDRVSLSESSSSSVSKSVFLSPNLISKLLLSTQ